MKSADVKRIMHRLERFMAHWEARFGVAQATPIDWRATAYVWSRHNAQPQLRAIARPHRIHLADLHGIDDQKATIIRNTQQFLHGLPANNVLLWGARGTGKSSLIKALLNEYQAQGLRLIEVDRQSLHDLPLIVEQIQGRAEYFVLFCDDLSFEANDPSFKTLKVALDGCVACVPENLLIYATSNRRQLLAESMADNRQASYVAGELRLGDVSEEKLSLVERFGICLAFPPFNQEQYLAIVGYWLQTYAVTVADPQALRDAALRWALQKASRSGRSAWQFAKDWVGQQLSN